MPYVKGNGWEIYDDEPKDKWEIFDDWEPHDEESAFPAIQEEKAKSSYEVPSPNLGSPIIEGHSTNFVSTKADSKIKSIAPYEPSSPSTMGSYAPGSYSFPSWEPDLPAENAMYNVEPYGNGFYGTGAYGMNPYVNASPAVQSSYGIAPYANGFPHGGQVYPYGAAGYGIPGYFGGTGGFGWMWPLIILGLILIGGYFLYSGGLFRW